MIADQLSEPSSDDTDFPRRLGQYVLLYPLGEGGMGRVYLALSGGRVRDPLCVIKRFGNPRSQFTPQQIEENRLRFRREATISMALRHPCIARTFHCVDEGNQSYLVEEFVPGMTLEQLSASMADKDEHFSIPLVAYIVAEIARAVDYLHGFRGLGLIHRDLTPSNIMFSKSGDVKIIDFGIAKATLAPDAVTKPHVLVGKPTWTAPEVIAGQAADRRADLYALGLLFWTLLAGRNPEGQRYGSSSMPGPSTFNLDVASAINSVVLTAIHKEPSNRFQTAREFLHAVTPFMPNRAQSQTDLANLVARFQPAGEEHRLENAVKRGRPLLDSPAKDVRKSPHRRWTIALLATLATGTLLAAGMSKRSARPELSKIASSMEMRRPVTAGEDLVARPNEVPHPGTVETLAVATPQPPSSLRARARRPRSGQSPATPAVAERNPAPSAADMLDAAIEALSRGDSANALSLARASAKAHPSPDAFIMVGRLLFESDPAAARVAFEAALRVSPGNREAERLMSALDQRSP